MILSRKYNLEARCLWQRHVFLFMHIRHLNMSWNIVMNSGSFLRNTLLSLRYPGSKLLPLREHPRLKLLGSLAAVLNTPDRQAEDRYLKLWRRFN